MYGTKIQNALKQQTIKYKSGPYQKQNLFIPSRQKLLQQLIRKTGKYIIYVFFSTFFAV